MATLATQFSGVVILLIYKLNTHRERERETYIHIYLLDFTKKRYKRRSFDFTVLSWLCCRTMAMMIVDWWMGCRVKSRLEEYYRDGCSKFDPFLSLSLSLYHIYIYIRGRQKPIISIQVFFLLIHSNPRKKPTALTALTLTLTLSPFYSQPLFHYTELVFL